jgi:2-iminobutanoate/2-iminopropanoate deaminase
LEFTEESPMTDERFEATALITAVAGREAELRRRLVELASRTVAEPGCIRFEIFEVPDSPGRFVLWEIFRDAEALREHMAADYTQAHFAGGLTADTEVIHQRSLAAPAAGALTRTPSPAVPGISDVVHVRGDLLLISGQTALGADGSVPEDFADELDAVFANLDKVLRGSGATTAHLARITIYVRDLPTQSLQTIRAVRDRWIDPGAAPASSLIGVSALFHPAVRVEIDAEAVAPGPPQLR